MTQTVQLYSSRITTIRPTMTMVTDLLPRVKETWIFNDCAIAETKNGRFDGLVVIRLDEYNEHYFGIIPDLHTYGGIYDTREKLDHACENYEALPADVFMEKVDWAHIEEGHRYL